MIKFIFYVLSMIPLCFLMDWFIYIYSLFFFFFFFFIGYIKNIYFISVSYGLGFDKYSYLFICLSCFVCLMMIYSMLVYSFYSFSYFLFYVNFLFFTLLMVFSVMDFFLFYFFFECSLVPLFLIIFGWGYQPERLQAGFFLILYTLFASFPFLLCIFYIFSYFGNFNYFLSFYLNSDFMMFFIIFSFLVKFPMFGFHIWLPKAHVEAPSCGSMILAGVMLKLGGYGFIRSMPFLYSFIFNYSYFFINLSLFGCLLISLYCLVQSDMKMLIAYSSVCHMSVVISGLFTMFDWCLVGSVVFMVGHGFVSSGLFFLVGLLYNRFGSRSFFILKGLMGLNSSMSLFWFMFSICNMSCPPSINLFSEICLVFGLLSWSKLIVYYMIFILFFSACYSLMIFSFSQHGIYSSMLKFFCMFYVSEFFVLIMHLFPIFFLMFSMEYFFYVHLV